MTEAVCSTPDQYEDEELDPRVQVELDRLNRATDEINKLETALEEANNSFRHDLSESSSSLQALGRKLGGAVEKGRPYFEAMQHARKLHLDCQRTAVQYHRANAVHQAARSTISLAEDRFSNPNHDNHRQFDPAWQEMLNHATRKVLEAEAGRTASEREHEKRAAAFTTAQQRVTALGRQLKGAISKARPYFEQKEAFDAQLEQMSQRVNQLQRAVANAKLAYSHALRSLEQISEEIHEQRKFGALTREPGVGAEQQPSPEQPHRNNSSEEKQAAMGNRNGASLNVVHGAQSAEGSAAPPPPSSSCGRGQAAGGEAATAGSSSKHNSNNNISQHPAQQIIDRDSSRESAGQQNSRGPVNERDKANVSTFTAPSVSSGSATVANSACATAAVFPNMENNVPTTTIDAAPVATAQDIDWLSKSSEIKAASLSIGGELFTDECLYESNPSGCDKSISYLESSTASHVTSVVRFIEPLNMTLNETDEPLKRYSNDRKNVTPLTNSKPTNICDDEKIDSVVKVNFANRYMDNSENIVTKIPSSPRFDSNKNTSINDTNVDGIERVVVGNATNGSDSEVSVSC
uniref:SH3 domain-binding protein 5 homolog n=2 Tax=Hirondellea gigas TaxID=1518452 RepID=A0A2P2IB43_9CRUS